MRASLETACSRSACAGTAPSFSPSSSRFAPRLGLIAPCARRRRSRRRKPSTPRAMAPLPSPSPVVRSPCGERTAVERFGCGVSSSFSPAALLRAERRGQDGGARCHALFRSLLYEACGRTINPVSGAIGLMWTSNWDLCQAAAEAVLRGESLRALSAVPAAFTDRDMDGLYGDVGTNTGSSSSLHSSPENSSSAPSRKRSKNNFCGGGGQQMMTKLAPPVLQSRELDLCLTPVSPLGGGERRCGASDEYSTTTCCEQEASGDGAEAGAPALLNLFN